MKKVYKNGRIVTDGNVFDGYSVRTEGSVITDVGTSVDESDCTVIDLDGCYLAPGFIDIHCHGGGGAEFIDGTKEAYRTACAIHAEHGTRVIFPTISATDYDTMYAALEAAEAALDCCDCIIGGVHLEGPYLSPAMCGGQSAKLIRKPDSTEYTVLYERFGKLISRWSYAPEEDNDMAFLKFLTGNGIVPAVAHSDAEYCHIKSALENGCNLITHLYSCTSTITRHGGFRHLGIVESAFLLDDIFVEAIADGKHLPCELLKMIVKIKGTDRVCLVTDSLRPGGAGKEMEGRVYNDCEVPFIIEDGVLKLPDRSAFAGSIATVDVLLNTAVNSGISVAGAVNMLTAVPARVMGLEKFGCIKPGYNAVFTAFDDKLNIAKI